MSTIWVFLLIKLLNKLLNEMLHVNESATIKWCQYFFGQLPIEQKIDYKKFKFLREMVYSEESCDLNIIYKFCQNLNCRHYVQNTIWISIWKCRWIGFWNHCGIQYMLVLISNENLIAWLLVCHILDIFLCFFICSLFLFNMYTNWWWIKSSIYMYIKHWTVW